MSGSANSPLPRVIVTAADSDDTWPSTTDLLTYVTTNLGEETDSNITKPCAGTVHDIELDKTYRLLILFLTIGLCIVGSILVVLWMTCNRRMSSKFNHLSRVNAFILNLTVADVLVILLAVLPQLVWEYVDRQWWAGDVMCRLVKFVQSFSMMSSNYMLVVIAIDRHQAIRAPLKESISIWKLVGTGWLLSVVFSLPIIGVFHTKTNENGMTFCENIFREKPHWHRQIWMTWVTFIVFVVPFVLLVTCYTRIFMEISNKALQSNSVKLREQKGHICLQSTHSNTLPKAKVKTLKMTFVIILTFIICTTPYFIVEMIMSYGNYCIISKRLYAILGGMAACNSATNPYVFLAFNMKGSWLDQIKHCAQKKVPQQSYYYCPSGTTGHSIHRSSVHVPFLRQDTRESNIELKTMKDQVI